MVYKEKLRKETIALNLHSRVIHSKLKQNYLPKDVATSCRNSLENNQQKICKSLDWYPNKAIIFGLNSHTLLIKVS